MQDDVHSAAGAHWSTGLPQPRYRCLGNALQTRVAILHRVAELLAAQDDILAANEEDVAASSGKIDGTLMQRLKLKPAKLQALAAGERALSSVQEPMVPFLVSSKRMLLALVAATN